MNDAYNLIAANSTAWFAAVLTIALGVAMGGMAKEVVMALVAFYSKDPKEGG